MEIVQYILLGYYISYYYVKQIDLIFFYDIMQFIYLEMNANVGVYNFIKLSIISHNVQLYQK